MKNYTTAEQLIKRHGHQETTKNGPYTFAQYILKASHEKANELHRLLMCELSKGAENSIHTITDEEGCPERYILNLQLRSN